MAADLYQSPGAKPPPYWRSPRNAHISGVCPAVSWTELDRPGKSPGLHKCTLGLMGKGLGKGGAKRHRKVLRDNIQGITKPVIRRLARRSGVKRISDNTTSD